MAAHAESFGLGFGVVFCLLSFVFSLLVVVVCCSFGFGIVWVFCFLCFSFLLAFVFGFEYLGWGSLILGLKPEAP